MADVFVSYSSYDKDRARLVAESLHAAGLSVWWDRDLKPGQSLHAAIKQAIDGARAVVVLWTAQSVASHWVCEEAEEARERQILVPVLMDDVAEPPIGFALIHAARLRDWNGEPTHPEWTKVVDAVRMLVDRAGAPVAPAPPPGPPLHRRLRSRLDSVAHAVSYATAVGTLFQTAAKWQDTVNVVVDHPVTSLICLLALAALFASTLFHGLQLSFSRWTRQHPVQEPILATVRVAGTSSRPGPAVHERPQPAPAPSAIRPRRWGRAFAAAGSAATALALGVVIVLLYLSTTGVHYVLLESAATYDTAVRRTEEINRALESSGETVRARPQRPHFTNPNCAILVGPYFSRSEAEDTLARLRGNSSYQVRKDAWVNSYSLADLKEAAARFLGWKMQ